MKTFVLYTILFFGLVICGYSQISPIAKDQYDSNLSESARKAQKMPRRIISITKYYSNSVLTSTVTLTQEFSGDAQRSLSVKEEGSTKETTERIIVAGIRYEKKNDGSWT